MMGTPRAHVLFVENFAPGVGYAWQTIGQVTGRLRERLAAAGVASTVCAPGARDGLDADYERVVRSWGDALRFARTLRRLGVTLLYLTDRPSWSWRYYLFRIAGIRHIIVHDRTSGTRRSVSRWRAAVKRIAQRLPGLGADRVIGISRFVGERLRRVNGVPPARLRLVYNGIDVDRYAQASNGALRSLLGVPPETPVVFTASRAQPYKGIPVLIDAARQLAGRGDNVHVAYCGDGPALEAFRQAAAERALTNFHFLGRRDDVARLLPDATIAVVPPVWEEAFGLTVVEAMAAGVPVVATRVGAIPELVQDGENGLLVPPSDPQAIVEAVARLLADGALRARLVARGRVTVRERFTITRTVDDLYAIVAELLAM